MKKIMIALFTALVLSASPVYAESAPHARLLAPVCKNDHPVIRVILNNKRVDSRTKFITNYYSSDATGATTWGHSRDIIFRHHKFLLRIKMPVGYTYAQVWTYADGVLQFDREQNLGKACK